MFLTIFIWKRSKNKLRSSFINLKQTKKKKNEDKKQIVITVLKTKLQNGDN